MNALGQSAFLKALGWALLDSIWQFAILFLLLSLFLSFKRNLSSSHKHGLALLLVFAGALWTGLGFFKHYHNAEVFQDFEPAAILGLQDYLSFAGFYTPLKKLLETSVNYISFVYLLLVAALSLRFFGYFYQFQKIRTTGITKIKASLRLQVHQMASRLGINKVEVWVSSIVDTPMIIGFLKPTILLPVASINYLSVEQLEAILLHELAHIKRNDYIINLLVIALEIAFFFNPFARLLIRLVKQERENSCDDWVLQFRFDRHQYASALLALEQGRSSYLSAVIAATGRNKKRLLHRVQRIMQVNIKSDYCFPYLSYFLLSLIVLIAVVMNEGPSIKNKKVQVSSLNNSSIFMLSQRLSTVSRPTSITHKGSHKQPAKKPKVTDKPGEALLVAEAPVMDSLAMYIRSVMAKNNDPAVYLAAMEEPEKDFSIAETENPVPYSEDVARYPFVPGSSYSYNIIEDTAKPKVKQESYNERIARESLAKAKMAFDRIDWKKIEQQLKTKANIASLKKQIEESLEQLNWTQINNEVKASINKETLENVKATLDKEYDELNRYKLQQQQYRLIQRDLQQQREKYKRDMEKQVIEMHKQIGEGKVVVHI